MELIGGYKVPYDPEPALARLSSDREDAISELWENLYHQGDVGSASYFAVPKLIENGEFYLAAIIEVARNESHNPPIPESFAKGYFNALGLALTFDPESEEQCLGLYILHASVNQQQRLAKALSLVSVDEILSEYA